MAAEPASVELGDYLGVIRRRYVVVGAAVAICVLLGAAYGLTRPDVYRANAQIALPAATDTQTPAAVTAEVQTELAVVRSELVAARAAEAIPGSDDTRTLLGRVSVEAPPDARILIVSYAAAGPEAAQRGAQAFAEAYLAQKESEQSATIETRAETFRERIASVEEGIDAQVALRDDAEEGSAEAAQAQDEIDRASTTLSDLTGQLTELESTLIDGGTIITPARLPQGPQPRGLARTLAAALAAGLLLGLGAAFVAGSGRPPARPRRVGAGQHPHLPRAPPPPRHPPRDRARPRRARGRRLPTPAHVGGARLARPGGAHPRHHQLGR
jgi:uncharacterized protein involved in exopolysaccharide biosynthesis